MKKKHFYETPSVEVVVLKIAGMLMTSGETGVENYNWNEEVTE